MCDEFTTWRVDRVTSWLVAYLSTYAIGIMQTCGRSSQIPNNSDNDNYAPPAKIKVCPTATANRRVSPLPSSSPQFCKVMESIIRDHIMDFFFQNNYFSKNQFGFIKGRSTALQLLRIMNEWTTQLDSGGQVGVIYTDFAKAFDTVPHRRFLSKIKSYNINQRLILWIQDFLCSRRQHRG